MAEAGEPPEQEASCDDITPSNVGAILERYRERLRRMVMLRMDPRIRVRADPSDVIQEAFVEVLGRLADYHRDPTMPFFLWVRFLTGQKLIQFHRRHLGAQQRAADREVSLQFGGAPAASSMVLASAIAASGLTSPSGAAMRGEEVERLGRALEDLDPADREVLFLRHFEHLSNAEVAHILAIDQKAASHRYWRAARRLRSILATLHESA